MFDFLFIIDFWLIVLGLLFFNSCLLFIQAKVTIPCSDHYYHLGLIDGIKYNGNRFVHKHPNFLVEENFFYPQFLHWLLSYLPQKFVVFYSMFVGCFLSLFLLFFYLLFVSVFYYCFQEKGLEFNFFLIICGLLFILNPYSFAFWNAKNRSISARGFGLLVVFFFLVFLFIFVNTGWIVFFIFMIIMTLIIILANQFALQWLIICCPIMAIMYDNIFIILSLLAGFLLHFFMFKNMAVRFWRGQYWHKYHFFSYMYKLSLTGGRESIWRDLIYDFWIKLFKFKTTFFSYFLRNSVVTLLFLFPCFMFVIVEFWAKKISVISHEDYLLLIPIFASLGAFLLTSFKRTRFIGEPERYLEFVLPFVILLFVRWNFGDLALILFFICYGFFLTLILFFYSWRNRAQTDEYRYEKVVSFFIEKINPPGDFSTKIISNNMEVCKFFMAHRLMVLKPDCSTEFTGPYRYKDIYKTSSSTISADSLLGLIMFFKIDFLLLDNTALSESEITSIMKNLSLHEKATVLNFRIYEVCWEN